MKPELCSGFFCLEMFSMKKIAILFLIAVFAVLLASHSQEENPRSLASKYYHDGLKNFAVSTQVLHQVSANFLIGAIDFKQFSEQVKQTRLEFKAIGILAEYFDPQMVSDFINGAPLPKIERKAPNLVIFEPKGLQRLDEIAASQEEVDSLELKKLTKELMLQAQQLHEVQRSVKIYDRHIFEACRTELLRMFSLGLTGFDTPGNLNCIEEAIVSMKSLEFLLGLYSDQIAERNQVLAVEIRNHIQTISNVLTKSNFETLDRLKLLKTSILPLYQDILAAQKLLGIEMVHEVLPKRGPINYLAQGFFDDDFLYVSYYSQISEKDKNPALYILGEYLFFDPILSEKNDLSCASCHKPDMAFQDGLPRSMASNQMGTVNRNAPSLMNAVFAVRYFHDMRSHRLQSQIEHVIFSEDEFNTSYEKILNKLTTSDEYVQLFREAFPQVGQEKINAFTVAQAITAYVETLHSWNSPFDRYVRGESNDLSEEAKRGFNLFMGKANCGTCHFAPTFAGLVPPLFTDSESEVLGITKGFDTLKPVLDDDLGRFENGRIKEKAPFYQGSFKTPTIRNVDLSAPYMHNGSFNNLEEVMHFYNKGGGLGLGLDVEYQTLGEDPLDLTQTEMNDIIAFMKSLNDTAGFVRSPERLPSFQDEKLNERFGQNSGH